MMTGLDRLSYQSRWVYVSPVRKFLLWLVMVIPAFTLPPLGQGTGPLLTAVLSCWLLRTFFWRWYCWMALPSGFPTVGVATILFNTSHDPQTLLVSILVGSYWLGISAPGLATADGTSWHSLAALAATFWLVLNLSLPQLVILLRRAHVLRPLTEQILLTRWFIFILLDEALAIYRAQTLCSGYCSLPLGYHSLVMLVGLLSTRVLIRYQ